MTDDDILLKSYEIASHSKKPLEYLSRLQASVNEEIGLAISRKGVEVLQAQDPQELSLAAKQLADQANKLVRFQRACALVLAYNYPRFERPYDAALMFHKEFAGG